MPSGIYKDKTRYVGGKKGRTWKVSPEARKTLVGLSQEKSPVWKGDKVGYYTLHIWVRKYKGSPDTCEHCGRQSKSHRMIQWANVDHKYRRKLEDYMALCVPCHRKHDKKLKEVSLSQ